jgi:hypothetical protein
MLSGSTTRAISNLAETGIGGGVYFPPIVTKGGGAYMFPITSLDALADRQKRRFHTSRFRKADPTVWKSRRTARFTSTPWAQVQV